MHVELLVVEGCPHHAPALDAVRHALAVADLAADVTETVIYTTDQAEQRGFVGSPTILVNGVDPFAEPAGRASLSCRLYATPAGLRGLPDEQALRDAMVHASPA